MGTGRATRLAGAAQFLEGMCRGRRAAAASTQRLRAIQQPAAGGRRQIILPAAVEAAVLLMEVAVVVAEGDRTAKSAAVQKSYGINHRPQRNGFFVKPLFRGRVGLKV